MDSLLREHHLFLTTWNTNMHNTVITTLYPNPATHYHTKTIFDIGFLFVCVSVCVHLNWSTQPTINMYIYTYIYRIYVYEWVREKCKKNHQHKSLAIFLDCLRIIHYNTHNRHCPSPPFKHTNTLNNIISSPSPHIDSALIQQ